MRFKEGNKLAKGGRRNPPGGRPSNKEKEIKKAAEELARAYIEKHIAPVLETYGKVAKGYTVKKTVITKMGDPVEVEEFVYDSQVLKHYMDRVIPPRAPENKKGEAMPSVLVRAYDPDGSSD